MSSSSSAAAAAGVDGEEEAFEHTLLVVREVSVYKIPPRISSGGYKCGEWLQSDRIWSGRLRVVSCGERCEIRLEDPNSGDLFAACFVQPGQRENSVETVLDSSRYFVLRIEDGRGKHAFVGLGFTERNEAFDFNVALSDHDKYVRREQEKEAAAAGGAADGGFEGADHIDIHPAVNHRLKTTIFLKTTKTIAVDVKTSDTIKSIKARFREIAMASDDPPPEIELAGRRLEDGRALMEYPVRKHSTLDVIQAPPLPMRVFVRLPAAGRHIMLEVVSTDTVHSVKVRIHRREGVPPDRQTLLLAGRPLEDGQRTLAGSGVGEGSTLLAIFRPRDRGIRVFVEAGEEEAAAAIDVKGWYTVRDVKAMGESALRLPQDGRRRVYRGEAALEEQWTVADCGVKTGAVLRLSTD